MKTDEANPTANTQGKGKTPTQAQRTLMVNHNTKITKDMTRLQREQVFRAQWEYRAKRAVAALREAHITATYGDIEKTIEILERGLNLSADK